ncbi:TPA: hypothetical protein ACF2VJ_004658 [Escherichia coli]
MVFDTLKDLYKKPT